MFSEHGAMLIWIFSVLTSDVSMLVVPPCSIGGGRELTPGTTEEGCAHLRGGFLPARLLANVVVAQKV